MSKELIIKFEDVKPSGISLHELVKFFQSFQRLLDSSSKEICKIDKPPIVSLVDIKDNCTSFALHSTLPEETTKCATYIFERIADGRYDSFPKNSRADLRVVINSVQSWGTASLLKDKKQTASIPTTTQEPKDHFITGKTTIYGVLLRIGGATEAKALIKPYSGDSITCSLNQNLAKQIASRIYTEIAVSGTAYYDTSDFSIQRFEIEEFLEYKETPITQALKGLYEISPEAWADIPNVNEHIQRLRSEEGADC